MNRRLLRLAVWMGAAACCKPAAPVAPPPAVTAAPATPTAPGSDDEKTLYALGVFHGRNLRVMNLTPAELTFVALGMSDEAQGKPPQVDLTVYGPKAQNIVQARTGAAMLAAATAQKAKDAPFLAQAAAEPGAEKLPSGLIMKVLTPGSGGASPKIADRVLVQYEGHLTDGTVFDSSEKRGDQARFAMVSVMPCWHEALSRMTVGEVAQLVCPPSTAFGDTGRDPKVPGGATLVFKVTLLEINPKETPALVRPKRGTHLGPAH